MWIQDLFFLHSHVHKINIWALALVISPFLGRCLGAFMVNFVSWRWPYWIFSIEIGSVLVAITLFVDETYYNRDLSQDQQPARVSRLGRLIGTWSRFFSDLELAIISMTCWRGFMRKGIMEFLNQKLDFGLSFWLLYFNGLDWSSSEYLSKTAITTCGQILPGIFLILFNGLHHRSGCVSAW